MVASYRLGVRMRIEHDSLGEKAIPDEVYYGVQKAQALENFHIPGIPISQYRDLNGDLRS